MENLQPLQQVFSLAVNNLQLIFHLNLSILEMEELCCSTQLPSSNTFTKGDLKYSVTSSWINEMRYHLSQSQHFDHSCVSPLTFCNFLSVLPYVWTSEMSTAPSSCAPAPNPEVIQPPYSYCLLFLAVHPGNLNGPSAATTSGKSYAFSFPPFLSRVSSSWDGLLLHKPDLHSLFVTVWPCLCMSWNAYLSACLWLSWRCPGCTSVNLSLLTTFPIFKSRRNLISIFRILFSIL